MCYIGRVRTTEEVMGEFNKPQTKEEYEKAMRETTKEIRDLIASYSDSGIGSVKRITRVLDGILTEYGY